MIKPNSGLRSNRYRKTVVEGSPTSLFSIRQAYVINPLDSTYNGYMKVELIKPNQLNPETNERTGEYAYIKYVAPFGGNTIIPNPVIYSSDTQKRKQGDYRSAYGMWMSPPDVGTTVLVGFAEENYQQGFYLGTIYEDYANFALPDHMVASTLADGPDSLSGKKLPAGEVNLSNDATKVDTQKKTYNENVVKVFEQNGLLFDEIRGPSTSSARREYPSAVFGISSPGPIDRTGKKQKVGEAGPGNTQAEIFINRLGGSTFVMDDGDDKFIRKTPASEGPPEYVNLADGEADPKTNIPFNEFMRFRTRTGHQMLMHNSEDLIYIANSKGTAWIELSSNGKIDVYASDSISMHTTGDFNFYTDRDFNLEAGRDINLKSHGATTQEIGSDLNILTKQSAKITTMQSLDIWTGENRNEYTQNKLSSVTKNGEIVLRAGGGAFSIVSAADVFIHDGDLAGDTYKVRINTGVPSNAIIANAVTSVLDVHELPGNNTLPSAEQLADTSNQPDDISSIMKRVPQKEPWPHHENYDPKLLSLENTDRTTSLQLEQKNTILTPDTFKRTPPKS